MKQLLGLQFFRCVVSMKKNLDIVEQQYHANSGGGIYK
jgi:hypothetical protein